MDFFNKLITKDGGLSSGRFINITGAFTGFVLIIVDTIYSGQLNDVTFGIYLGYCGGVYTASKTLSMMEAKWVKKDDTIPAK